VVSWLGKIYLFALIPNKYIRWSKLSVVIKEVSSFKDILKMIDDTIASLKQQLAENLKKLEDARVRAEQVKKLRETFKNLLGEEVLVSGKEIDLKDAKILINPDPLTELKAIEEAIEKINTTILALQNLRKSLEPWTSVEVPSRITVVIKEGIPVTILLKL
jgi:predicted  nucleic acid-binding Zn-ribbon protein